MDKQQVLLLLSYLLFTAVPRLCSCEHLSTWDCGKSDRVIHFKRTSIEPSPIIYPGNVTITTSMDLMEDLPRTGLYLKIRVDKLEPQRMPVPCLNGVGSCQYDVCSQIIEANPGIFCSLGSCSCPLIAKSYTGSSLQYSLPRLGGPVFAKIVQGNFEGNVTFFNKITSREYGCLGMKFTIKANT